MRENKYDLSIILPGLKPELWISLYKDLKQSVGNCTFELIAVGPREPPQEFLDLDNTIYVQDYGHPSRCVQRGTTLATGKYITYGYEDGTWQSDALEHCVKLFEDELRFNDGICVRYYEKDMDPNAPLPPQPPEWPNVWCAWYHKDLQLPGVPLSALWHGCWMYNLDFFREIGGIDCRFEHVNMNCNDLAFRVQANGGNVVPSPDIVIFNDNQSATAPEQGPIESAFHENDNPLFKQIYADPDAPLKRFKIDYDNWKSASEVWERRFKDVENKYDLSVILPGIKPEKWRKIYDSVVESVGNYSFEFICVGPYEPPQELLLLEKDNFKYVKDFGHPSRCLQRSTTFATGKFMTWGSEDGIFQPLALSRCIDLLSANNRHDALTVRFFEQDADPNAPIPDQNQLWTAWYHRDLRLPGIRQHFKIANIAMYYLDYYREIGGIDCRFEHVNMNCNDLAFRVQEAGGSILPSPDIVIRQTNIPTPSLAKEPGAENRKPPTEEAYHENDYPLFYSIYVQETGARDRIKIDYDNWKQASEVWERRFGKSKK